MGILKEKYLRHSHFKDKFDKLFRNLFSKYMETTFCSFYIFGKWLGDTMEINVLALEKEYDLLTKSIESFYENILNIYNELNWASGYWNDFHARLFFTNVNSEKIKLNNTYNELKSLNDIYTFLIEQYKSIGNKIRVNLEEKNKVITKFNDFREKINELVSLYNDLDLSFCTVTIANKLAKQKQELIKIKEKIVTDKEKVKNIFEKIEQIEKDVNLRLSKINIEIIKEADINEFM